MSLSGALNIGRTALAVNQAAIQVIGNNIANVGNENYTRQTATLTTVGDTQISQGQFLGNGVNLEGIGRQIDEALEGRLRSAMSDSQDASSQQQWLSRIEGVFNELGDEDLSTQLSNFFNSWSDLANKPQDLGVRQIVLQNGETVAKWFQNINGQFSSLQGDLDARAGDLVKNADLLAGKIANLNIQIVQAEGGGATGGQANGLRDQRDQVLKELGKLMNITTKEQSNGVVNVYVGSEPLVFDGRSNGVTTKLTTDADGTVHTDIVYKTTGGKLALTSGQLGGLVASRGAVDGTVEKLNDLASGLIFELNKIHSGGQGLEGFSSAQGTTVVEDSTVALNDAKTGMKQFASSGSFVVHVRDKSSGTMTSTMVKVDLDGQNDDDTTLDSLVAQLDAIDGITATNNAGRLKIVAENSPAEEITFSQDTSGALAALGVNNFFNGRDAQTIAVNQVLRDRPQLLAAARNGSSGDNQTALLIADLETRGVKSLGGATMKDSYQSLVNTVATQSSNATNNADASDAVVQTLKAQHEALSGVSMDEEALNLIKYQRAFQGAAKLVQVVNEMMDTMLGIIR